MIQRHLILVGMMGVGKSSLGRRLSRRLGLPLADSDVEVERAAGMPISDIYAKYGEEELRAVERRVMQRLLQLPPHIIATGGDAFADDTTRALLLAGGTTVWLCASLPTLLNRIRRLEHRPLLLHTTDDMATTLARLLAEREAQYAEAHHKVITDAKPVPVIIEEIVRVVG